MEPRELQDGVVSFRSHRWIDADGVVTQIRYNYLIYSYSIFICTYIYIYNIYIYIYMYADTVGTASFP